MKQIIIETENSKVSVSASNIDADKLQSTENKIIAKERLQKGQKQDKIITA
jgi:hypothetical protein